MGRHHRRTAGHVRGNVRHAVVERGPTALERSKQAAFYAADETFDHRLLKHLQGCRYYFINEAIDVSLVTYLKPAAAS